MGSQAIRCDEVKRLEGGGDGCKVGTTKLLDGCVLLCYVMLCDVYVHHVACYVRMCCTP